VLHAIHRIHKNLSFDYLSITSNCTNSNSWAKSAS